jgi:hypothetical protein
LEPVEEGVGFWGAGGGDVEVDHEDGVRGAVEAGEGAEAGGGGGYWVGLLGT